jgi:hypothetical protein
VEEVGAHGRDCTGFFGFGWVLWGLCIIRYRLLCSSFNLT